MKTIHLKSRVKNTNPTNQYKIVIKLMHGDADAYTTETAVYDTGEKFLAAYTVLKNWLDFKKDNYNLGCDLQRDSKQDFISGIAENSAKKEEYYQRRAKDFQKAVDFLGEFDGLYEMFASAEFEIPGDCTCDHQILACVDSIESMTYFDENGIEFDATVE